MSAIYPITVMDFSFIGTATQGNILWRNSIDITSVQALSLQTVMNTNAWPIRYKTSMGINKNIYSSLQTVLNSTTGTIQISVYGASGNTDYVGIQVDTHNSGKYTLTGPIIFNSMGSVVIYNLPPTISLLENGSYVSFMADTLLEHPTVSPINPYAIWTPSGGLNCLLKGTKILTPTGEIVIESLKIGDDVITSDNRTVKVTGVYSSLANADEHLYVIRKNVVSDGVPNSDLFLSGGHRVRINGKLMHPFHGKSELIEKCDTGIKMVPFYHLALENYLTDFLVANGLEVESNGNIENPEHVQWDCSGDQCKLLIEFI